MTALTILLCLLAWEIVERSLVESEESARFLDYARGISIGVLVAVIVSLVAARKGRDSSAQLRKDLQETTSALAASENLLAVVLDASPAAVLVLDEERRLRQANAVARRIHGKLLVGETFSPTAERCQVCPGCDTVLRGDDVVSVEPMTDPHTGEVLSIVSHPARLADGSARVSVIVEEIITQQQKLRASLVHQEKMAAFGMVAAGVAHEMGNPLSSIEMHLQLLDDSQLAEEDAESVKTLRGETARLRRTLRELVDFARRRRTDATSVSVESVIRDALQLMRYDPRMRRVETKLDAEPDVPAVSIVEDHLMQVMVNLLINAVDSMPDGGHLRIDTRHIGGQVAIRIRDDGTGMAKGTKDRCFEALFTTKDPGKGTGLGLSICRDVLETAGGTIELHSALGQGTTVVVTLPEEAQEPVVYGAHERVHLPVSEPAADRDQSVS